MSGSGNQDEIDALFADAFGGTPRSEAERRKLHARFLESGGRFDAELVLRLMENVMRAREEKGQETMQEFLSGRLSQEACRTETRKLGYGLWWGAEACWHPEEVSELQVETYPEAGYEIHCRCIMEYESAHMLAGEGQQQQAVARVVLGLDTNLRPTRMDFQWE